ncbi:MAG: FecCD family ABC transporter permease [Candidatus Limnocylindrales bacterium]
MVARQAEVPGAPPLAGSAVTPLPGSGAPPLAGTGDQVLALPIAGADRVEALFAQARRRTLALGLLGLVALLLALVAGVGLGEVVIPPADTVAILARQLGWPVHATWPSTDATIVLQLRLPRVLAAMAVGASLALAGTAFQGLLRNPLADPYVLGTASGAALGAALGVVIPVRGIVLGFGLLQGLAFVGALGAVVVVYRLSRVGQLASMTGVLLTGYAVSSLLAAGLAVTMWLSGDGLRQIFFFLLGGFDGAAWPQLAAALPALLLGGAVLLSRGRALNALLLGEETAAHLGLDLRRERILLLGAASLVTAASVAIAGLIGFVGLVVPHVVRLVVGPNARAVLPLSAIWGAAFLVACDLLARIPGDVPVGVVTALLGAPFFLWILRRARGGYEL